MNLICGSLMVASLFQVVVGFSGLIGLMLRFIGPITFSTIITLVGLHLYPVAVKYAGTNWSISSTTSILVLIFTLYLADVPLPIPTYTRKDGYRTIWFKPFKLFPLILAVLVSWAICAILTAADVFTDDPKDPSYLSRTDARISVIREAKWIRVPYPGQWGMPTVSVAAVFGITAGVISSIIESIGDYYACARLAGAAPPPTHAINRGIGIEGVACVLSGALGAGNGVTSFSENVAAIGITRVGSRSVILCSGIIMIVFGVIGKFGALVSTIPTPVVGGLFIVLFGLITSVGIANLQFVDVNSTRNMTIFGFSIMAGMGIPYWMKSQKVILNTGSHVVDQVITVLLTTEIAVGGLISALLDNTAPGSLEERGLSHIKIFTENGPMPAKSLRASTSTYDLPSPLQNLLNRTRLGKYIPFLPYYYSKDVSTEEC